MSGGPATPPPPGRGCGPGAETRDGRTARSPSSAGVGVRAWAGFPVWLPDGQVLGSFCVVDTVVHEWTAEDVELLEELAAIASREVSLRLATLEAKAAWAAAEEEARRAGLLARGRERVTAGREPRGVGVAGRASGPDQ